MSKSVWEENNCIKFKADTEWCYSDTLDGLKRACADGCFPVVEWFITNRPMYIKEEKTYYSRYSLFMTACSIGNLEIATWMTADFPLLLTPDTAEEVLMMCCPLGQLEVIKWIYQNVPNMDLCCESNYAFELSLYLKEYDICDWLYKQRPDMDINNLFINVCGDDDVQTVEYLYKTDPNIIYARESECFVMACSMKNVEVAEWLHKMVPHKFSLDMENGEIKDWQISIVIGEQHIETPETCMVCYEKQSNMITRCHHQFCNVCVCNIFNVMKSMECPYCRQYMTPLKRIITS